MKKSSFILLFALCITLPGFAQGPGEQAPVFRPNVTIPKAPNVAALEKFIENPVSLHTGLQDVTIPIYQLETKGISIPISLKYHSAGVKVDDISSDVGLGWVLEAGGVVSSSVYGLPDNQGDWPNEAYGKISGLTFGNYYSGFNVSQQVYETTEDPLDLYTGGDIDFLKGALRNLRDTEPDMYFFSAPGKSGKFYTDGNGQFQTVPYQKVKIETIPNSNSIPGPNGSLMLILGFKVTDETGNLYEFKDMEYSTTLSTPSCGSYYGSTNPNYTHFTYQLSRIITPFKDTIVFSYTPYSYSIKNQTSFSRVGPDFSVDNACSQMFIPFVRGENCYVTSTTSFTALRLNTVTTNNGYRVEFNYSNENRQDLAGKYLKQVVVKKGIGASYNPIKTFDLQQSYFVSSGGASTDLNYRLKLTSAGEQGKPSYRFQYNETPLPPRLSYSQDHWGFYNGKPNTTLLPEEDYNGFETGANRQPDFTYSVAGILTKVTYPTQGYLELQYEPHVFYSDKYEVNYTPNQASLFTQPNTTVTKQFTLPASVRNKFFWTNTDDGVNIHNDYCKITLTGPNNFLRLFYGNGPANGELVYLTPGDYTITIETGGTTPYGELRVAWIETPPMPAGNRTSGGLRVKKTLNCTEPGQSCLEKNYEYLLDNATTSSGVSVYQPLYTYKQSQIYLGPSSGDCGGGCGFHNCNQQFQSSTSLTPLFNSQGANVIYRQVNVYDKTLDLAGKTSYKFLVDEDWNVQAPSFPFGPIITFDWLNGLPLETTRYSYKNQQLVPVNKVTNSYSYSSVGDRPANLPNQYSVYGVKVGIFNYPSGCFINCANPLTGGSAYYIMPTIQFGISQYQLISSWHYLNQTVETQYSESGSPDYSTTTQYFYDNPAHIQMTSSVTTNSKGETTRNYYSYPLDFLSSNTVLASMQQMNMLAIPVEKRTELVKGGVSNVVGSNLTLFRMNGSSPVPDKVLNADLSQPVNNFAPYNGSTPDSRYAVVTSFDVYDNFNNAIQFTDRSGMVHSFIYDYGSTLPVAAVTNSTADKIAYTSFEADGKGNWNFSGTPVADATSPSGTQAYSLTAGNIQKTGLSTGLSYWVSYWYKSGASVTLTGGTVSNVVSSSVVNGWVNVTEKVSGATNLTLSGSGMIDELRLYPDQSQMTTYTHVPGVGVSSIMDENGMSTYFQYDSLNRLQFILDNNRNVVKKYTYNYKQQQ